MPVAAASKSSNTPTPPSKPKTRSSLNTSLTIITALILIVISNQWHLASHHLRDLHLTQANYFSASFATFLGQDTKPIEYELEGSYITSPICAACYRGFIPISRSSCYDILERYLKKNSSLLNAAEQVADKHTECKLCSPSKCYEYHLHNEPHQSNTSSPKHQFKYWRYDRASPKFTNPTTLFLNSIPSSLRIPPSRFNDIANYFTEQYWERHKNASNSSGMDFLMEYNPGIVTLTDGLKESLPKEAAYLVSLRVTPANNCFSSEVYTGLDKDVWEAVYHTAINHLGLALLDANYQILPGYEVVIEIDKQLDLKREIKRGTSDVSPTFMDYRIFLLNGEVYLHANSDTTSITKLKLKAKGFRDVVTESVTKDPSDDEDGIPYRNFKLTNLYGGDLLEVYTEHQFNTLWSGGIFGKNYALFGIPNVTHPGAEDSVYAELDIYPGHRVHQVVLDEYEYISLQRVFEYIWKPNTRKRRKFKQDKMNRRSMRTVGNITEIRDAPPPSFHNVDTPWYPGNKAPFKESVHGGACCVEFTKNELNLGGSHDNHHESLLVGIAHTKVPWRPWYNKASQQEKDLLPHTHYVSLFYAFDPHPPFQLRARSGFFCLGFVPETHDNTLPSSEGGQFNPHSVLTRNRMLKQNNITFDCPQMSFVSSFVQKANDASSVVIGYGLNDCTGRLVEVTKEEVVRLLFPPLDMVVEDIEANEEAS